MPRKPPAILAATCLALAGCASVGRSTSQPDTQVGSALLHSANGQFTGAATLVAAGDKLTIVLAVANLPGGVHAVHLHMAGSCVPPDFASAGGHLNPDAHQHGRLNPKGKHFGDLPNLIVGRDGSGKLVAELPGSRRQDEAAIFDADGTAIVVHSDPDDYRTDPSGNSGPRIACGVFRRS